MPNIKVLFFAQSKELIGGDAQLELDLQQAKLHSVRSLSEYLMRTYPCLEELRHNSMFALNLEYIPFDSEKLLSDGDEVAFIPPIRYVL